MLFYVGWVGGGCDIGNVYGVCCVKRLFVYKDWVEGFSYVCFVGVL